MVVPVAGPVEPPNFAWRGCRRQCVKHGQNRCRSDTCAKQNNGPITRSKSETPPWCARVQYVADSYVTMHVGTRQAVQFLLDTNSIVICAWHVGERITAQKRWRIGVGAQAQDDELSRLRSDQRTSVIRYKQE